VPAGDIKKCYTKVAKKEKDEMILDEMCGGDHPDKPGDDACKQLRER
jgi:hypothetical protein